MCILFYSTADPHSRFSLILASNRDEFTNRPSIPASWTQHRNDARILSGRDNTDGREGGTWLGLNSAGVVGVLLNLRPRNDANESQPNPRSRGFLLVEALSATNLEKELGNIASRSAWYSPFQILIFEPSSTEPVQYRVLHCDNESCSYTIQPAAAADAFVGAYGNTLANAPYRKVVEGRRLFEAAIRHRPSGEAARDLLARLLDLLHDKTQYYPDEELRARFSPTSFPDETLAKIAAIQVDLPEHKYGTVASTAIAIESNGTCHFVERTRNAPVDQYFTFQIATSENDKTTEKTA